MNIASRKLEQVTRLLAHDRDRPDLASALRDGRLTLWCEVDEEPDEQLRVLGDWYAETYTVRVERRYARLGLPEGAHIWLFDDEESSTMVLAAFWEILGPLDGFDAVVTEWEFPPPAAVPAAPRPCEWKGLSFRSQAERRIGEALERANVMFGANARVRVGLAQDARETLEPDFWVVSEGQLGILEVDGPSHDGRAAKDNERLRTFKRHGIAVVEPYPAEECYDIPDHVVADFLSILHARD